MTSEFSHERTIEFVDTDMAGIVHFSNFFRYMEAAEHAFFGSLGLSLHRDREAGGMSGWARVHAECDYASPLRYRDALRVDLSVREMTHSTVGYDFTFHRRLADAPEGAAFEQVARGAFTVAYVGRDSADGPMRARRIPAEVASRIKTAPSEHLNKKKD